jgi:hypothetical protein
VGVPDEKGERGPTEETKTKKPRWRPARKVDTAGNRSASGLSPGERDLSGRARGRSLDGGRRVERRPPQEAASVGNTCLTVAPKVGGAVKTTDQRGVALPVVKRVKESRPLPLIGAT